MKFEDLRDVCPSLFELSFLRQAFGVSEESDPALAVQLSRWVHAGKLNRLRSGLYEIAKTPAHFFEVANRLVEPSYISGAWALSYYSLIPDAVMEVTSAVGVHPRPEHALFTNHHGRFSYAFTPAFAGYREIETGGDPTVLMAFPEKALVDWWCWQQGDWPTERHEEARYQNVGALCLDTVQQWAEQTGRRRVILAAEVFADIFENIKSEEESYGCTMAS